MKQNQIEIFPWNDSFNTGVDEIDEQHKELVRILNQVASSITFQNSHVDRDSLIRALVDYALFHFQSEENYWLGALHDHEFVSKHRDSHNRFVDRVNALKQEAFSSSEEQWLDELLSFLASWLASHILESDKHMAFVVEAVKSGMNTHQAITWADEQMQGLTHKTIAIILNAYAMLSANTIQLMREIKTGNNTLNQLVKSEGFLQEAMDYAKIGRWSILYNTKVAEWSPQMYTLFGLKPSIAPGPETLCTIMKNEFHQPFFTSLQRSFDTGDEHHVEYQITRPIDGEERWIECRGKINYDKDGTPSSVSGFVQDITERKENESKITKLAYYDPLTSLPNRRLLFDRLNQTLALSDRKKAFNAILFIDIDNFKHINDTHGHEYGDVLLQQAAKRISNCIRQGDTLARIGGDEFVLILSSLDILEVKAASEAEIVAHKVLRVLSLPYHVNRHQFNSSASIGVTLFNDSSILSSELMKQADIAMYQAKDSGKNAAYFYQPQMQQVLSERIKLEKELTKALKYQQFELYYQPQINNHDKVIGAEALIRWLHPKGGMISPDNFIPLAEETGLIIPIGDWVLERAFQMLSQWKKQSLTQPLTLSVNVSYKQFRQPDFVSKLERLIKTYDADISKLKLELTETMLVDDIDLTLSNMEALKKSGILFSLDDFGTGYSSLQHLKRLPISQLKIDRSFISELETNIDDQSIVKTTILMANALGINVIAEGVETSNQSLFLKSHGCLSFQGFYYSKPIPIDEFNLYVGRVNSSSN
jgi:diguanylate cyclase (GGDEF)-like protein/hemerythrin-like metal-binding protein/PAS domain S-box-containing protein